MERKTYTMGNGKTTTLSPDFMVGAMAAVLTATQIIGLPGELSFRLSREVAQKLLTERGDVTIDLTAPIAEAMFWDSPPKEGDPGVSNMAAAMLSVAREQAAKLSKKVADELIASLEKSAKDLGLKTELKKEDLQ